MKQNETHDYLVKYGGLVAPMALAGDAAAKAVRDFYSIYYQSPSLSAWALVEAAVADFRVAHPEIEHGKA